MKMKYLVKQHPLSVSIYPFNKQFSVIELALIGRTVFSTEYQRL